MAVDWGLGIMPDIGGNAMAAFERGQQMRRQEQAHNALTAYAQNPNGQTLNALAVYNPEAAIQYRGQMQDQQAAQQKQHHEQIMLIGRLLDSATDETTYQQSLAAARRAGIDLTEVPQQFDPTWVNQTKMLVRAYSNDGGQQISGLARELQDAGYKPGTPEFTQAMQVALSGKYGSEYVDQNGDMRRRSLPGLPTTQPTPPAQPTQPGKVATFEAAMEVVRNMGPRAAQFVRDNHYVVRVTTPEQARQLPSGTPIQMPDGSEGVVP